MSKLNGWLRLYSFGEPSDTELKRMYRWREGGSGTASPTSGAACPVWSRGLESETSADRRNPEIGEGRGQAVGLYSRFDWRRTAACRSAGYTAIRGSQFPAEPPPGLWLKSPLVPRVTLTHGQSSPDLSTPKRLCPPGDLRDRALSDAEARVYNPLTNSAHRHDRIREGALRL